MPGQDRFRWSGPGRNHRPLGQDAYATEDFVHVLKVILQGKASVQFVFRQQGAYGLRFCGYADFWWQNHLITVDEKGESMVQKDWQISNVVFLAEPQLWYNVGRWVGLDNFNIGGEVELSFDLGGCRGFWARPRAGIKWVF